VEPKRLLLLALVVEGGLGAIAVGWIRIAELPVRAGDPLVAAWTGGVTALLLAGVGYWILELAPGWAPIRQFRDLCRAHLVPLFSRMGGWHILAIGAMAGGGEELLFRGALQAQAGLVIASLLFGLAHFGGVRTFVLALWAAGAGFVFGGLAIVTGGILAPVVAHGLYDALAIAYLRWGRGDGKA
jgi:membrane protease YdiL (CAAX protease family)